MFVTYNPFILDVRTLVYLESQGNEFAKSTLLEPLIKSKQRTGLVQVERTVTKKGTTFTQKFWTRPDRVQQGDLILQGRQNLDAYEKRISQMKEQQRQQSQFVELNEEDDTLDEYEYDDIDPAILEDPVLLMKWLEKNSTD